MLYFCILKLISFSVDCHSECYSSERRSAECCGVFESVLKVFLEAKTIFLKEMRLLKLF
jgi:hypothetical protein